jgi:hypothetical protein
MNKPASKLSLQDVTDIAREVVRGEDHLVIGAVPAEGGSEYAELVVALNVESGSSPQRLTIGVHRADSIEGIREQIAGAFARDAEMRSGRSEARRLPQ